MEAPVRRPRYAFGQVVGQEPRSQGTSPQDVGFWGSARVGFGTGALDVRQRWQSLFDDDDRGLTGEEIAEQLEGRAIDVPRGTTQRELERRIGMYDRDEWATQFDTGLLGELAGGLPPYFLDPVSLALAPVGGTKIRTAVRAGSIGGFMRDSSAAGARIGAASIPLEVGIQQRTRGEVDSATVLLSSIAPIAATPLFASPAWARTGLRNERQLRQVISSEQGAIGPQPSRVADAVADRPELPSPPVRQYTVDTPPPRARLDQTFEGYEGGAVRWAQDFAMGSPQARTFAQQQGIDPDATSLRDFVVSESREASRRSQLPARDREQLSRDIAATIRGEASPEARERMTQAGVMDAEGRLIPGMEEVARGRAGDVDQIRQQMTRGLEARAQQAIRTASARQAELDTLAPDAPNRAEVEVAVREARQQVEVADEALERVSGVRATLDENVDPERLMQAVDAARVEDGPNGTAVTRADDGVSPEARQAEADAVLGRQDLEDMDLDDVMAFHRQFASEEDVAAVSRTMREYREANLNCAGGRGA